MLPHSISLLSTIEVSRTICWTW